MTNKPSSRIAFFADATTACLPCVLRFLVIPKCGSVWEPGMWPKLISLLNANSWKPKIPAEQGLLLGVASFDKLAYEYLDQLEDEVEQNPDKLKGYRYAKGVAERYLVPFFGRKNIYKAFRRQFGRDPHKDDPVFCNYKGERISTFNNSLIKLLEAAYLRTDAFGNNFTAYCFRGDRGLMHRLRSPSETDLSTAVRVRLHRISANRFKAAFGSGLRLRPTLRRTMSMVSASMSATAGWWQYASCALFVAVDRIESASGETAEREV